MKKTRYVEKYLQALNFLEVSAAKKLGAANQVVVAVPPSGNSANYDVTLPDCSEAIGCIVTVRVAGTPGTSSTVTVKDCGYGAITIADAITIDKGYGVYYSDGLAWYPLVTKLS